MPKTHRFDYFAAFISQAKLAAQASEVLVAALEDFHGDDIEWLKKVNLDMHRIENEGDVAVHDLIDHLAVEFMPPIDREDVTELALLLDDVTDSIEEVMQHVYMYDLHELHPHAVRVARVINEAAEALCEAVATFPEFRKQLSKLDKLLVAVHDKESEGDMLYIEAKRDLFVSHADAPAAYLLAWNGMFSHMEKCCDSCEHVASVMQKIALKNS